MLGRLLIGSLDGDQVCEEVARDILDAYLVSVTATTEAFNVWLSGRNYEY